MREPAQFECILCAIVVPGSNVPQNVVYKTDISYDRYEIWDQKQRLVYLL